jgi:hypothetical protein
MWAHGFSWFRDTVGAYIVTASVVYLLVLLSSLPARSILDRKVDALVQKGEVAFTRAEAATAPMPGAGN